MQTLTREVLAELRDGLTPPAPDTSIVAIRQQRDQFDTLLRLHASALIACAEREQRTVTGGGDPVFSSWQVIAAVNGACSCGGKGPNDGCCQACEVYHRLTGRMS